MPQAIPFIPVIAAGIGAAGSVAAKSIEASQSRGLSGGGGLTGAPAMTPGAGMTQIGLDAFGDLLEDKYGSGDPEPPEGYESSPDVLSPISFDPRPPAIQQEIEQYQFEPSPWGGLLSSRLNPNGRGYY
jgi:hypothetical protein